MGDWPAERRVPSGMGPLVWGGEPPYGSPLPELEGHDVTTAIEEVLVDVGMIADERLVDTEVVSIDRGIGDSFTVRVESLPAAPVD